MIKQRTYALKRMFFLILTSLYASQIHAIDIVKLQLQQMSNNKAAHNVAVIQRALEVTEAEYGPFQLEKINMTMSSARMLHSLIEGQLINTAIVPASVLWDKHTTSVKVPVRQGLLSYRLLLVNKSELAKFDKINSLEELKKQSAGLHKGWETTKLFNLNNFKVVETGHFEGLFSMLDVNRFDYIPRAIYEVYDELASRKHELKNITVEPTLALNIPTMSYVNVSPKSKRLAQRFESGLLKMKKNGELKALVYQYYGKDIKRANLASRKVIKIDNPNFNEIDSFSNESLLTDFNHSF